MTQISREMTHLATAHAPAREGYRAVLSLGPLNPLVRTPTAIVGIAGWL